MNAKNFGLAGGIVWGVSVFVMTLLGLFFDYGLMFLSLLKDIYPFYSVSPIGSLIGLAMGFLDGFIGFFLLIWVYNFLENKG